MPHGLQMNAGNRIGNTSLTAEAISTSFRLGLRSSRRKTLFGRPSSMRSIEWMDRGDDKHRLASSSICTSSSNISSQSCSIFVARIHLISFASGCKAGSDASEAFKRNFGKGTGIKPGVGDTSWDCARLFGLGEMQFTSVMDVLVAGEIFGVICSADSPPLSEPTTLGELISMDNGDVIWKSLTSIPSSFLCCSVCCSSIGDETCSRLFWSSSSFKNVSSWSGK